MKLALAALLAFGCTSLKQDGAAVQNAAQKLANSPAVELVLHGEEADWVRKMAELRGGAVDLDACAIGCILIYLTPHAFDDRGLRAHEFRHCQQWRADPLGFPVKYALQTQTAGYAANVYELDAYRVQGDPNAPTADADR